MSLIPKTNTNINISVSGAQEVRQVRKITTIRIRYIGTLQAQNFETYKNKLVLENPKQILVDI